SLRRGRLLAARLPRGVPAGAREGGGRAPRDRQSHTDRVRSRRGRRRPGPGRRGVAGSAGSPHTSETTMSDDLVKECLAARDEPRSHRPPSETKRLSLTEAYAAQDRLRDALLGRGERVAGWKAGFTSKAGQESWQVTEPVCAFLLASGVLASGAEIPAARFVKPGVEAEVAFVMKYDLAGPGVTAPRALQAGDVVMSGSVSKILSARAGDTVRATFTRLGSVSVRFA